MDALFTGTPMLCNPRFMQRYEPQQKDSRDVERKSLKKRSALKAQHKAVERYGEKRASIANWIARQRRSAATSPG